MKRDRELQLKQKISKNRLKSNTKCIWLHLLPLNEIFSFKSGSEELREPPGSEAAEFKPVKEPSGSYNILKTHRYAMELIRKENGEGHHFYFYQGTRS